MKTAMLVAARMKSTRLPRKLLQDVCGRPILAHMLDRLKLARRVDQIIICTSTDPRDDELVDLARAEDVAYFRGSEDDVVRRLYDATVAFGLDYALHITGDCPFADPVYMDRIVAAFEATHADLIRAWNLPHGAYSYGMKPEALKKVLDIKDEDDTEVWVRFFTETDLFEVYDLPIEDPRHRRPDLRMTLDYPEDLAFFRAVFAQLYHPGMVFDLDAILRFLDDHPEVIEINRHCGTLYRQRWSRQATLSLKPRYTVERVAVLGCGSIGRRHIGNLRRLGVNTIVALRSRKGHTQELDPELGVREVDDWEALVAARPDAAIISSPTSLHLDAAMRLLPYVHGLFIEKPLAASLHGVPQLLECIRTRRAVSFVGFNLQVHPAVLAIQDVLARGELGEPISFQCQVGQWLPDWHPYEDYRQAYFARQDLGGGVLRTLSHDLHLAVSLLGAPRAVSCTLTPADRLPLDVDVIADVMLTHASAGVSQIHLDYMQRPLHRCGVISCERGWLSYDLVTPRVTMQSAGDPLPRVIWEQPDYDLDQSYVEELRTFLRYVAEGRVRHEFDAWRATQSLAVVDAAFASAESGCLAPVPDWVLSGS